MGYLHTTLQKKKKKCNPPLWRSEFRPLDKTSTMMINNREERGSSYLIPWVDFKKPVGAPLIRMEKKLFSKLFLTNNRNWSLKPKALKTFWRKLHETYRSNLVIILPSQVFLLRELVVWRATRILLVILLLFTKPAWFSLIICRRIWFNSQDTCNNFTHKSAKTSRRKSKKVDRLSFLGIRTIKELV